GGIGEAIARELATRAAHVAVHYHRGREAATELVATLPGNGHAVFGADLADAAACNRLVSEVVERFGDLHLLVNNAGIFETHPPLACDPETWAAAWRRTLDVNLLGPALLSHAAALHMVGRGVEGVRGRIVHITSRGAFRGEPDAPAYGASKAGLNAFGQSLAKALAPHGVLVFSIAPGWVDTERVAPFVHGSKQEEILRESPLGRVAEPAEVARVVAFLASPGHDSLTGCIIDLNGASYLRT
ncbi:MAG: SDR family oxidoreductase, partial [Acidobacteria bacterium]|nr:SDR family oxidoreductase [Acidobacteriota bacterium]